MNQLKEQADFVQMENIDLCQALKGTIFNTQLNKLWDIKKIIKSIEVGFSNLQWDHCEQKASIACEGTQENSYELYCEVHSGSLGPKFNISINLTHELRFNTIILNDLEGLLIRLQERIEYFSIEKNKNHPLYQKVKELIDENFGELNTLLESLASKCSRIDQLNIKIINSNSKMKYEYLSFIKDDDYKCKRIIFKILSMFPEVWEKMETDSLIQVIVESNEGVPFEKEVKENLASSIPDHIYGKEHQLVHIPTQSLIQFKEFEKRIKTNCLIIENCVEVCLFEDEPSAGPLAGVYVGTYYMYPHTPFKIFYE